MSLPLEKLCRTCMEETSTSTMLSLWKTDNMNVTPESPSILYKLVTLTTLNIIPNDGLPENICIQCIGSLNEAYDFKQKSERTDAKLRLHLKDISVKQYNKPDIFEINLETYDEETLNRNFFNETNNDSLESINQEEYLTTDEDEDNQSITKVIEPIGESSEEKDNSMDLTSNEDFEGKNLFTISGNVPDSSKINVIMMETKSKHSDDDTQIQDKPSGFPEVKVNDNKTPTTTSSIGDIKFECSKCSAKFSYEIALQTHQKNEDCSEALHECAICQRVYCRRRNLSEHMLKVHKKKLKCTKCSEEFDNLAVFNNHMKYHSDQLKCDALMDSTSDSETIIFKCSKCYARFPDAKSLGSHQLENKCTQCEICKKVYSSKSQHIVHMRKIHNQQIKCSECDEEFTKLRDLNAHLARTHRQKNTTKKGPAEPQLCPICGKRFTQSGALTIHMRRHNQIKPHKCTECDLSFINKTDLTEHFRRHTGELPYICEFCGYAFRTSHERTQHRRIHTGEKRHECDVCKRRFTALNTLKVHRRTHTGERPYACSICERKFARQDDMKKHIKVVHLGEKRNVCKICGEGFRQSSTLKTHMKTHQVLDFTVPDEAVTQ